jgi:TonB family protein
MTKSFQFQIHALLIAVLSTFVISCRVSNGTLHPFSEQEPEDGIIDAKMADESPMALYQPVPDFPPKMLSLTNEGTVLLSLVVTKNGDVRAVRVLRSTDISFALSAKETVATWRFRPAVLNGKRIDCRMHFPITFHLEKRLPGKSS